MATTANQQNRIHEILSLSNDRVLRFDIHSSYFLSENNLVLEVSRSVTKIMWVYNYSHFVFLKENLPPAKSQWLGSNGWLYVNANKSGQIKARILSSGGKLFMPESIVIPKGSGADYGLINPDSQSVLCVNLTITSGIDWTLSDIYSNKVSIGQWLAENQIFRYLIN